MVVGVGEKENSEMRTKSLSNPPVYVPGMIVTALPELAVQW